MRLPFARNSRGVSTLQEPASTNTTATWKDQVAADTASISSGGFKWIGLSVIVFIFWGTLFPISSAVVASGTVISKGRNKLLQHPSGGVVQEILARNGDIVKKGEPILVVDPSVNQAEYVRLHARQQLLIAQKTRLTSIKSGLSVGPVATTGHFQQIDPIELGEILGGDNLLSLRGSTEIFNGKIHAQINAKSTGSLGVELFSEQESEFDAAWQKYHSELSGLNNRLQGQKEELDGINRQMKGQIDKVALLRNEASRMAPLAEAGHISRASFDGKKIQLLEEETNLAALEAASAGQTNQIGETSNQIETLTARTMEDNSKELSSVLSELAAVNKQLEAARKALSQTIIRAPETGVLAKLETNTIGGVISATTPFGELVPVGQPVIVEAKVAPADISEVSRDQATEIVITAFNRRVQDPLQGSVIYVSADSVIDEITGEPYFPVQIDISENSPSIQQRLQSGMLSEVYIQTGSRSFLSYLAAPISDSFSKAFNER